MNAVVFHFLGFLVLALCLHVASGYPMPSAVASVRFRSKVGRGRSTSRLADIVPPWAVVDLACEQDGKFCWVVTGIPYSPSDLLAHVISRGIAAYGASASVVSVHADNVYLPEDRWHGEIGHRRVLMVLKDGTSFLQLVADNGKLTAEVKALSTKIEDLEAANEDLKVEIKDLKVEIKDQKVEIKDQKVEIKDLIEKDVVKATKIENLEATNKDLTDDRDQRRLSSREQRSLMILKDVMDAVGARQVEGKFLLYECLVSSRNDDVHFLRMGQKSVRDPAELQEYCPSRAGLDSRAVLCAKLKMVRDFVQQGLPEVRMSG
jgi:hypothetical protein